MLLSLFNKSISTTAICAPPSIQDLGTRDPLQENVNFFWFSRDCSSCSPVLELWELCANGCIGNMHKWWQQNLPMDLGLRLWTGPTFWLIVLEACVSWPAIYSHIAAHKILLQNLLPESLHSSGLTYPCVYVFERLYPENARVHLSLAMLTLIIFLAFISP